MTYSISKHFLIALLILFFFWPQSIYAANPPNLIFPADNSTAILSPKLTWEYGGGCVEDGSCFRVEVDNSADFSSIEKSTYTNNFSYSPQGLAENTWHWRVKAKDKDGNWSSWSNIYKFTLSTQSAPSPIGSPEPSTEAASPQASQKSQTSFTIKDIPSEINSNQEFEASVSLILPNNPNQTFYLKGAFKKEGSSNYFGQTQIQGDWIKNNEKYLKQLKIVTDPDGNWEGKIKVKPDSTDSGFEGSGNYIFKAARYSQSGSGPTWSNELNLKISAVEIKEAPATSEAEIKEEPSQKPEVDITASLVKAPTKDFEIKIASVAGEATMSNNISLEEPVKVLEEKKVNWFLITLGVGVLASGIGFTYFKFKKEKSSAINTN